MAGPRVGEILVRLGLITEAQLAQALAQQRITREFLGEVLLRMKFLAEADLMRALSDQFGLPLVSLTGEYVDWSLCMRHASVVIAEKKFVPFREENDAISVAISNPLDVAGIARIEDYVRPKRVRLVLVPKSELDLLIAECVRRSRRSLKDIIDRPEVT